MVERTSGSLAISLRVAPTICGRTAAALANSIEASCSALLAITFTWFLPSCSIAEVTCLS